MSDNKDTKKKGFFSKLFGRSDVTDTNNESEKNEVLQELSSKNDSAKSETLKESSLDKISKTALKKMTKAKIVEAAAEQGFELDIKLRKDELIEAYDIHFNSEVNMENSIIEDDFEEPVAEETPVEAEATSAEETPAEPVAEETPVEAEASSAEETPAEPAAEETPVEAEASSAEETPVEPAAEETPAEPEADEALLKPASIDEQSPAQIIKKFESQQLKDDIPPFRPGDTVVVSVKVREGDRTRLQAFEGVVMNIKNAGLNSAFIVRKISSGIGVERTFQLHSPMIDSIKVKRKGDVRQAKLYYLRDRSGRSARIKERLD